jgi:hypothetical protein
MAVYFDASVLRGKHSGIEMASVRADARAVGQGLVIPSVDPRRSELVWR